MSSLDTIANASGPQIFVGVESGLTVIAPGTPLTRLNYYDGKFLRADDLDVEQSYFRELTWLSNVAGGSGVVYGFDVGQGSGDTITISPGLAIDPSGKVLLLPQAATVDVAQLIADTERLRTLLLARRGIGIGEFADCIAESVSVTPPAPVVAETPDFYLVTIAPAEALCGEDYVYGTLCEEACATSVQRPRRLDGIAVRAWPFTLTAPLPTSTSVTLTTVHLRSRLASARFADEAASFASLLATGDLRSAIWCHGACAPGAGDIALAVLVRSGSSTAFVDEWAARRELIETPPRRYWTGRLGGRPLAVFLAQVLQFQCQLSEILPTAVALPHLVLNEAVLSQLLQAKDIAAMHDAVAQVPLRPAVLQPPPTRVLINGGIVELPPAGYLPVGLDSTVNDQVRKLLGEGVALTFCVVRPDYVPHAFEEAQHLARISLLAGLDDPAAKPDVEILVPDGEILRTAPKVPGEGWEGRVQLTPQLAPTGELAQPATPAPGGMAAAPHELVSPLSVSNQAAAVAALPGFAIHGAGRSETLPTGGGRFNFAGTTEAQHFVKLNDLARGLTTLATARATDFHLLGEVAQAHANEPPPPPPDETLVASVATIAREASLFSADQRVAAAAGDKAVAQFVPPQAAGTRVVGLWATLGCDRNPFSLRLGEQTALNMTVFVAMPAQEATTLSYEIRGEFRADGILPVFGSGTRVVGTFSGIGAATSVIAGKRTVHAGPFERTVVVVLTDLPNAAPRIDVSVQPPARGGVAYDIHASWDGSPLTATVGVTLSNPKAAYEVPLGTFTQNPDVLVTGNQANTLARSALEIVAASLADPSFVETADALLFPPPVDPTAELTVKPHRNWVLFRRRRTKECASEVVVAPPPAKRYDVFELAVASADQVQVVRQALWQNKPELITKPLQVRYVDRVEFAGGQATLNTAATAVRADWQAAQPEAIVEYAAIADLGQGEGEVLARSRLVALEQALSSVTTFADTALTEAVPQVLAPFVRPGADGAILIVTQPAPPTTTCMLVLGVTPQDAAEVLKAFGDEAAVDALVNQALNPPPPGPLTHVPPPPPVRLVGQAIFAVGSAQVTAASATNLQNVWSAQGQQPPDPGHVFVFSRKGDAAADSSATRQERGQAIAQSLGTPGAKPIVRELANALPGPCPAVVFVFPKLG